MTTKDNPERFILSIEPLTILYYIWERVHGGRLYLEGLMHGLAPYEIHRLWSSEVIQTRLVWHKLVRETMAEFVAEILSTEVYSVEDLSTKDNWPKVLEFPESVMSDRGGPFQIDARRMHLGTTNVIDLVEAPGVFTDVDFYEPTCLEYVFETYVPSYYTVEEYLPPRTSYDFFNGVDPIGLPEEVSKAYTSNDGDRVFFESVSIQPLAIYAPAKLSDSCPPEVREYQWRMASFLLNRSANRNASRPLRMLDLPESVTPPDEYEYWTDLLSQDAQESLTSMFEEMFRLTQAGTEGYRVLFAATLYQETPKNLLIDSLRRRTTGIAHSSTPSDDQ